MIVRAELIKPFTHPEWQIEPTGNICDAGDIDILNAGLRSGRAQILASDIRDHPPYTHVLRYHYEDAATDFLVQIDTSDYLVQMK